MTRDDEARHRQIAAANPLAARFADALGVGAGEVTAMMREAVARGAGGWEWFIREALHPSAVRALLDEVQHNQGGSRCLTPPWLPVTSWPRVPPLRLPPTWPTSPRSTPGQRWFSSTRIAPSCSGSRSGCASWHTSPTARPPGSP